MFRIAHASLPLQVVVEQLEDRVVPATLFWDGDVDDQWTNPLNWSDDRLPGADDNVHLNVLGSSVRFSGDSTTVRSIANAQSLVIEDGFLTVTGGLAGGGDLTVAGGTLELPGGGFLDGGSVSYTGGQVVGTVTIRNGSLTTTANAGPGVFQLLQSNALFGEVPAAVALVVNANAFYGYSTLALGGDVTNRGTIRLIAPNDYNGVYTSAVSANGFTLTNAASGVIRADAGAGGGRTLYGNLTNFGTIQADGIGLVHELSGGTARLLGGTVGAGSGTYFAHNGLVDLSGSALGNVSGQDIALGIPAASASTGTIHLYNSTTLTGEVPAAVALVVNANAFYGHSTLALGGA